MKWNMQCRLFVLGAILVLFPATSAQALVIGTGCAGGTVCTMQELLAGGSLQIDDKLFDNFRGYSSNVTGGAEAINPSLILVTDYKVFGGFGIPADEIGLVFFEFGAATTQGTFLQGGQTQLTSWTYTVSTLGPLIVDNTLLMSGGGFADVPAGASLVVNETAGTLSPTGQPIRIADKSVFENTSGLQTEDHRDFAGVPFLDIVTQMNLNGGPDPADLTINTQILFLVETFSQQQAVPAPGSLALLGLGFLALAGFAARGNARR